MTDLAALRESLRKLAPHSAPLPARRDGLPSGFAALDDELAWGGLPRGAVTEISGVRSSGKTALALTAIARHTAAGGLAVWIDGGGQLFPPTAAALGVALERLLVVRPTAAIGDAIAAAAAQAAEIVARSGVFAVIAIDLPRGAEIARSPAARTRGAMQRSGACALVIGERGRAPSFDGALARLRVRRRGDALAVTIDKGGKDGAPASVVLPLGRARVDGGPVQPIADVTARLAPGLELTPHEPHSPGGAS
jgi:hypothetical protein